MPRSRVSLCAFVLLILSLAPAPALAGPGDLDPAFDGDGRMTFQPKGLPGRVCGFVIDRQGRFVIAGTVDTTGGQKRMAVARVLPSGGLDASFGVGGVALANFASVGEDVAVAVAMDSTDRILVAGTTPAYPQGFAIAAFLPNGSPDLSVGVRGVTGIPVGGILFGCSSNARVSDLFVQPDGRIFLSGNLQDEVGNNTQGAFARTMAGGALDVTLAGRGIFVATEFEFSLHRSFASARHASGKLVSAGSVSNNSNWEVVQYTADGIPDNTFSGDGRFAFAAGSLTFGASEVVVQPNGAIIAAGGAMDQFSIFRAVLARILPTGTLDPSFDGDGLAYWGSGFDGDLPLDVQLLADGRILTTGYTPNEDVVVMRGLSGGTLDPAFGTGGFVRQKLFGTTAERGVAIGVDAVSRYVVCGDATGAWGIARLQGDAPAVGTPDLESPGSVQLAISGGNPFTSGTAAEFALPTGGEFALEVHDVSGARVRTIARGSRPAGVHHERWDGRDDSGRDLPSGVYFFRLLVGENVVSTKAVKVD